MEQIEKMLTEAGIRPTAIRNLVLKQIIAYGHTFTLAEMEEQLETIDKSTLFRTLSLFLEHKLLHEVDNGSASKLYCRCECKQQRHISHLHFTCTACGQTFCIKDINTSSIPHPKGFVVDQVNCVMKGLCPKCLKKC